MDGKFSPFFYTSAYDHEALEVVFTQLLTTDRDGAPIAGIDWPSVAYSYDINVTGTGASAVSTYSFILKKGLVFSDGTPLTAKDVLFSMYVMSDPLYDGMATFYTMNIQGISEYRTQTTSEINAKYTDYANRIYDAGVNADGSYPSISGVPAEEQAVFWNAFPQIGYDFCQEIVDYVCSVYASYLGSAYFPYAISEDELMASETLQIAYGMVMWGFAGVDASGMFEDLLGNEYDLTTDEFTIELYWENMMDAYGSDFSPDGIPAESAGIIDITSLALISNYIATQGAKEMGGANVPDITGITYGTTICDDGQIRETIEVVLNGIYPTAIFQFLLYVCPWEYYTAGFNGQLNEFGVSLNDNAFMNVLKDKNDKPMGAGPYIFINRDSGVVTYEANDLYLLGSPKIKNFRFQELPLGQELDAATTGTVHFTDPSASNIIINDITAGEGDYAKLSYILVDNDGYGYIGVDAQAIPEFEVRQALAYAMDTTQSLTNYGELASINYRPMTKVLWAYPDNPQPVYPHDPTGQTSKDLFLQAGYIYNEATNVMTYPADHEKAGQQVSFKFTLPVDAVNDHPAGFVVLQVQELLATIGIILEIDLDRELLNKLNTSYESGIQLWAAAWGSGGVDPDMFQIWMSDPAITQNPRQAGLISRFVNGSDEEKQILTRLNTLIEAGRSTLDMEERKTIYAEALELATRIVVEIPTYQRKNMYVYNHDVINDSTLLQGEDVTPFQHPYRWFHLIELN